MRFLEFDGTRDWITFDEAEAIGFFDSGWMSL